MASEFFRNSKDTKVALTELEFYKDAVGYFLSARYRIEDEHSIREISLPKISLRIFEEYLALRWNNDGWRNMAEADIGFGFCTLRDVGGDTPIYFTETVIEEKVHEMTLDEIEKKLGYKVKIVNK